MCWVPEPWADHLVVALRDRRPLPRQSVVDAGYGCLLDRPTRGPAGLIGRLTVRGATVVVLTERPGLGIRKDCSASECNPMVRRMIEHGEWRERWNELVQDEAKQNPPLRTITIEDRLCPAGNPKTTGEDQWLCDDALPSGVAARPDGTHLNLRGVAAQMAPDVLARAEQAAG